MGGMDGSVPQTSGPPFGEMGVEGHEGCVDSWQLVKRAQCENPRKKTAPQLATSCGQEGDRTPPPSLPPLWPLRTPGPKIWTN